MDDVKTGLVPDFHGESTPIQTVDSSLLPGTVINNPVSQKSWSPEAREAAAEARRARSKEESGGEAKTPQLERLQQQLREAQAKASEPEEAPEKPAVFSTPKKGIAAEFEGVEISASTSGSTKVSKPIEVKGRMKAPSTEGMHTTDETRPIDYGACNEAMMEKYGPQRGDKMYQDMIDNPNSDRGLHFVVGQKILMEKKVMMRELGKTGPVDAHHYQGLYKEWISRPKETKKSWSDSAREASIEARKPGTPLSRMNQEVRAHIAAMQEEILAAKPKPTPAQKDNYRKVSEIKDKSTFSALLNRKIGAAEGKAKVWEARAKTASDPVQKRKMQHIAESYRKASGRWSESRDAFEVAKGVELDSQELVELLEAGEFDSAICEDVDAEVGVTEADYVQVEEIGKSFCNLLPGIVIMDDTQKAWSDSAREAAAAARRESRDGEGGMVDQASLADSMDRRSDAAPKFPLDVPLDQAREAARDNSNPVSAVSIRSGLVKQLKSYGAELMRGIHESNPYSDVQRVSLSIKRSGVGALEDHLANTGWRETFRSASHGESQWKKGGDKNIIDIFTSRSQNNRAFVEITGPKKAKRSNIPYYD